MTKIAEAKARQILDSRGTPTVEVEVHLSGRAKGRVAVTHGVDPDKTPVQMGTGSQ